MIRWNNRSKDLTMLRILQLYEAKLSWSFIPFWRLSWVAKCQKPENFLASAMLEQKAWGSIILNYVFYKICSFHIFIILKLLPLDTLCGVQWPIFRNCWALPIYHPIELIGFAPNLKRDLLEDFQITWKLIKFISPWHS